MSNILKNEEGMGIDAKAQTLATMIKLIMESRSVFVVTVREVIEPGKDTEVIVSAGAMMCIPHAKNDLRDILDVGAEAMHKMVAMAEQGFKEPVTSTR